LLIEFDVVGDLCCLEHLFVQFTVLLRTHCPVLVILLAVGIICVFPLAHRRNVDAIMSHLLSLFFYFLLFGLVLLFNTGLLKELLQRGIKVFKLFACFQGLADSLGRLNFVE
jgi:hypothetical protein